MEGHRKFLWGEGVLKAKILEAKYEVTLEFLWGSGVQNKNLPLGEYGYFRGTAHSEKCGNGDCEICEPASHASHLASHASYASHASHASHSANVKSFYLFYLH